MVGGYGCLGRVLAPKILKSLPQVVLTIAGRSSSKALDFRNELSNLYPERVNHACIDVADKASLDNAPPFDVLLMLLTTQRVCSTPGVGAVVYLMNFAASRNAHFIEAVGVYGAKELEQTRVGVGEVKPVMLLGAGYMPGMMGPMTRIVASQGDGKEIDLITASTMDPDSGSMDDLGTMFLGPSVMDICKATKPPAHFQSKPINVDVMMDETMLAAQDVEVKKGKWVHAPNPREGQSSTINGKTYWISGGTYQEDVKPVAQELGLKRARVSHTGDPDMPGGSYIMCGMMGGMCFCFPCLRPFFKCILYKGFKTQFQADPGLCIIKGFDEKGNSVVLEGADGSMGMTANGVLAGLEQILDGTIEGSKPPRMCGVVLHMEKTVESLKRQGCKVTICNK